MGPTGVFFQGFLEHPRMVGSIIPSSDHTIAKMLAPVKWDECKVFVEYGPGVGTFCRPVLDRLPRDGALVVIDTNPLFIDYLKRTVGDSRFHPVLGSAADVEAFGFPCVLKTTRGGYDGKGVWVVRSAADVAGPLAAAEANGVRLLAEELVDFRRELSGLYFAPTK